MGWLQSVVCVPSTAIHLTSAGSSSVALLVLARSRWGKDGAAAALKWQRCWSGSGAEAAKALEQRQQRWSSSSTEAAVVLKRLNGAEAVAALKQKRQRRWSGSGAEVVAVLKWKQHAGAGAETVAVLACRAGVSCERYCSILTYEYLRFSSNLIVSDGLYSSALCWQRQQTVR